MGCHFWQASFARNQKLSFREPCSQHELMPDESEFEYCRCEKCRNGIEFPSSTIGMQILCPHCGSDTTLGSTDSGQNRRRPGKFVWIVCLIIVAVVVGGWVYDQVMISLGAKNSPEFERRMSSLSLESQNAHIARQSYEEAAKLFENCRQLMPQLASEQRIDLGNLALRYAVMDDAEASRPDVLDQLRFLVSSTRTSSGATALLRDLKAAHDKRLDKGLHPL